MSLVSTDQKRLQYVSDDGNTTITAQQQPDGTWVASLSTSVAAPTATQACAAINTGVAAFAALVGADPTVAAALAAADAPKS